MIGHKALIEMRRDGFKPPGDIHVLTDATDGYWARNWWTHNMTSAYVEIATTDSLRTLDLRYCVGMPVTVTGSEQDRVRAVAKAFIEAGAKDITVVVDGRVGRIEDEMIIGKERVLEWLRR